MLNLHYPEELGVLKRKDREDKFVTYGFKDSVNLNFHVQIIISIEKEGYKICVFKANKNTLWTWEKEVGRTFEREEEVYEFINIWCEQFEKKYRLRLELLG